MARNDDFVPLDRLRRAGPVVPARPTLLRESPVALAVRAARRHTLSAARVARWLAEPASFPAPSLDASPLARPLTVLTERASIARHDPHAHPAFEHGKRHNLRLALPAFDQLALCPERPFSFWRTLGPLLASRGFIAGMELRGGCVVPSIGGGICLLSNALYRLALRADFVILERHGHSLEAVPVPDGEPWAADATVAFAHIDLRFAPREGRFTLCAHIDGDELVLALRSDRPLPREVTLANERVRVERTPDGPVRVGALLRRSADRRTGHVRVERVSLDRKRALSPDELGRNCLTCGELDCHARDAQRDLVSPALR